ncbi:LysR family transcriptional regulator [Rhodoplanes sp. TEM]|uniref:LysR family transcriptional regulator n=1 Tax=Rhodoplanes tepidamans TaxID=200616 RepID=A0ABT5J7K8_RHOTP|nr:MULTISPECIES: LysR family transcriptional regulator [Rhodoplanes]MDC7785576.1 LysR family transcriptional regulator [Rhodoplanes tepidamans]MDC7985225.1 LysR family transcriptional regulator [Rhodoplanes sp. TEM]MDQ0353254.1 DNA-binding transcriptional LysR family regulator [Rhodoplanes tepidamans]
MIELRQFRQFVAVAEELSFRRAAERLHMAQPPLTASIRKLETELGTTLLERTNRVERLTPAGRVFLEEARRALAQAERAIRDARRAGEGLIGSLRLTFVASSAHSLLPQLIRSFRARHAEVALDLQEASTAQQVQALQMDRADLGLVVLPLADPHGLTVVPLVRDSLVVALPGGHHLARRRKVALAELSREPWIRFPARYGPGLHSRITAACAAAGFVPQVVQEALQMETIVGLVAAGLGVAVVSPAAADRERHDIGFRPLVGPGTPIGYDIALAYPRATPVVEAFVALARSAAADRPK